MDKLLIWVRTVLLTAIGVFSAYLLLGEDSWVFLNPRFALISTAGGIGLCAAGIAGIFHRAHPPSRLQIILFALLFSFLLIGNAERKTLIYTLSSRDGTILGPDGPGSLQPGFGLRSTPESRPGPARAGLRRDPAAETDASRFTRGGKEYIKISLAELYLLTTENRTAESGPTKAATETASEKRFLVRGMVKRTETSDRLGQFVLARTAVTCCLADAVSISFRVAADDTVYSDDAIYDEKTGPPAEGTWVAVYGTVEKQPLRDASLFDLELPGIPFNALEREHVINANAVVPVPPPEIPFMFLFSKEEPFNY
jgi:hypothetical protein